jgi:hypothetical protein
MATRRYLSLLGAGMVGEAVYLTAAVRLPLLRYGGQLHRWASLLGTNETMFAICLAGIGVLLAAYLWGWRTVRRGQAPRWLIWGGAIVYALTLLWLLPITADLFMYLVRAHMFTDLGANPLQIAPLTLLRDPLVSSYVINYEAHPTVYGPAWTLLSALGTTGPYDVAGGLFYLKGLAVAAYLGCAWLVEQILRRVQPESVLEGLYLFAWNPLVLLMAVGDGHNDVVMMALVLLAGWWLLRERWVLAFGALALSVWVKYVSVLLVPLFLIYVWWRLAPLGKRRLSTMGQGVLLSAGVSILVLAPFWYPGLIPGLIERLAHPVNSSMPGLPQWMLGAGLALFVPIYGVILQRIGQRPSSFAELMNLEFVVTLLIFVLGAARSQPWHLLWPAALAGLTDKRWVWPMVIAVAAALLAGQVWVEWGTPGLDFIF